MLYVVTHSSLLQKSCRLLCALLCSNYRFVRVLLLIAVSGVGYGEIARRDQFFDLLLCPVHIAHDASSLAQHRST